MKLAITYDGADEAEEVKVKPRHIAAFETAGYKMDMAGGSLSWLYRLAWFAKDCPGTFEQWLVNLDEVSGAEEAEIEPGPSTPGSPN